jgi:hypothetical protein
MIEPTLASLRAAGAHRHDPVRFHYLEALARRMQAQPAAVQQRLAARWQADVADYAQRAGTAPAPADGGAPQPPATPLAELNRYIQSRTRADTQAPPSSAGDNSDGLKSVQRFGEVWARISAEQKVAQALERGPENAGPLNSHMLMLRSLALMRTLSPDYLRRFLSQMESLLWLEQAGRKTTPSQTPRSARRGAPRK